jgi:hypothetical protein
MNAELLCLSQRCVYHRDEDVWSSSSPSPSPPTCWLLVAGAGAGRWAMWIVDS